MSEPLLEYATSQLLAKFGAGGHKPGSGSAAAFQGLLSAQLQRTLIDLTSAPKRRSQYGYCVQQMSDLRKQIDERLYPELEDLFARDAAQFDKAIQFRKNRDAEIDPLRKSQAEANAQAELQVSTEIPIDIAYRCIDLAKSAFYIFDHGFKAARGDAGVAMHSAVSAVAGCISIINLNLLTFKRDSWSLNIRAQLEDIRTKLDELFIEARARDAQLDSESKMRDRLFAEMGAIASLLKGKASLTDNEIEGIAIRLQKTQWRYSNSYRRNNPPSKPVDILDPQGVLTLLDFRVQGVTSLGQHRFDGRTIETAGIIDQNERTVLLSEQFTGPILRFTAAHELGHALLHNQTVLHRDIPSDGTNQAVDPIERQANRFATFYLMPKKLVVEMFYELFGTKKFQINTATALAFGFTNSSTFREQFRNARDLSRFLAGANRRGAEYFDSISEQLGVSVGAMAIRLEELDLVTY